MRITLNKKKIKNLTHQSQMLEKQNTPQIAGGNGYPDTWGACSLACDTAMYLGCPTGDGCYSGFGLCPKP